MNGKIAKSLRRIAQLETVGRPGRRLLIHRGVVMNDPLSTRGFYLRLKKEYKHGTLNR